MISQLHGQTCKVRGDFLGHALYGLQEVVISGYAAYQEKSNQRLCLHTVASAAALAQCTPIASIVKCETVDMISTRWWKGFKDISQSTQSHLYHICQSWKSRESQSRPNFYTRHQTSHQPSQSTVRRMRSATICTITTTVSSKFWTHRRLYISLHRVTTRNVNDAQQEHNHRGGSHESKSSARRLVPIVVSDHNCSPTGELCGRPWMGHCSTKDSQVKDGWMSTGTLTRKSGMSACEKLRSPPRPRCSAYIRVKTPQSFPLYCSGMSCIAIADPYKSS